MCVCWGESLSICVCAGESLSICVCVKAISAVLCGLDGVLQGGPRSAHRRKGDIRGEGVKKECGMQRKGMVIEREWKCGEEGVI